MKEIMFDEVIANDISKGVVNGKIKTRNGLPVRLIHFGAKGDYPIVGLIEIENEENVKQWTRDGKRDNRANVTSVYDLTIELEGGEVMKKYYIMGSVINNRHIRNAFEAAGYNVGNLDCSDELCLYYGTPNGDVLCTHHPAKQRAIKENQEYQELPL